MMIFYLLKEFQLKFVIFCDHHSFINRKYMKREQIDPYME